MPKKINKQVTVGHYANGKRIIKWIHADTLADFRRQEYELKKQYENYEAPVETTFKKYSAQWLETYKANKSTNTYNMYKNALNKASALDAIRLADVTRSAVQSVINANIDKPRTCQTIALTLKQVFHSAIKDGIINRNPAEDVELPKYKAKEKRSLTEAERKLIKTVELQSQDRMFLDVLYYFGLRRGEALALTRSDFDFKRLLLRVNKSVAFNGNTSTVKATKTLAVRYVPIPKQIESKIKRYLDNTESFMLFTTQTGDIMTHSGFVKMWQRIDKALNGDAKLNRLTIHPHDLRHDYATRLYYVPGISTKKKAEILGHSEQLFLSLYSHLDSAQEDLETFQSLMNF